MKALRRSFVLECLIWILFGLLILIFRQTSPAIFTNAWLFSAAFLYFLLFPGWLLARIFRIRLEELAGRWLCFFALGLGFYFIINFVAIFVGMSLAMLSFILILLLIVLLIVAFYLDLQRKEIAPEISISLSKLLVILFSVSKAHRSIIAVSLSWLARISNTLLLFRKRQNV